ncbi:hypothetical protein BGZ65_004674 [Modicella reniformis]|uniref:Uncharacterized protein n=1 Tax=Modicella reniformis TaxID=1440133 RepID=A0A9P6SPW8_9FUNG|nr:hypothetical protein BGZ65_004674 [Modicella reniformis]
MSTTINEHIRLLSTAVGNLWSGSVYKKSLDYLLRILLRLNLAPNRESKYWNRTHSSSIQEKETEHRKMNHRKWKYTVKRKCDRLADAFHRGENNGRAVSELLESIRRIAALEPPSVQTSIPNIECRLAEMTRAEELDESDLTNLHDDDEEEDDEVEIEEDKQEDDNAMVTDDDDKVRIKEPSRAKLQSLQAMLQMLIESPRITHDIRSQLSPAMTSPIMSAYLAKRRPRSDGKGFQDSLAHVVLRAPIVLITNNVLRAAGYTAFTRRISPQLGAVGIYETFCSRNERQFDVQDASGQPLTNYLTLQSSPSNKRTLFESFFDMKKVESICYDHGLLFRNRITYVDEWTVRLTGRVIANGEDRRGYPVVSKYDKRRKTFRPRASPWVDKYIASGLTEEEIKHLAQANEAMKKQLENDIKPFRKAVKERQIVQSNLSRKVGFGESSYQELHSARVSVRDARREVIPREEALRNQRQVTHHYNKMAKAAESCKNDQSKEPSTTTKKLSTPTWEQPAVEDDCEYMDLSQLLTDSKCAVVYAGTDYGIVKMSETVAMTPQEMQCHLNRYGVLHGLPDSQGEESEGNDLKENREKGSMKITAGLLNNISHTTTMLAHRQKRLENNEEVHQALKSVSEASKTLHCSMTITNIDEAQTVRRANREVLRQFEWSRKQRKAKHNQELRSKRAISKICAAERRFVQKLYQGGEAIGMHNRPDPIDGWCEECSMYHVNHNPEEKEYRHRESCPRAAPRGRQELEWAAESRDTPGEEGKGCGKSIPGTAPLQSPTSTTPRRLQYAKSRRVVKGKAKTVAMKGSQECINPDCVSFRNGHTIKARDVNSAAAIAIAGASTLLHRERKRLPPFSRDISTTNTNNTSL